MKQKILWITRTAVILALLVTLQAVTKPFGQFVTGSCVNLVLALSVLLSGLPCGLVVALVSPVLAFLLGIAPQILTVPAIMAGNCIYVLLLRALFAKQLWRQALSLVCAAVAKFLTLYGIVAGLICGVLAQQLLDAGLLKTPMLQLLPATFSWPQLVTALIGGLLATGMLPVLKKAIRG